MSYSKTAIKELTRQYKSVLKKCLLFNLSIGICFCATSAAYAGGSAPIDENDVLIGGSNITVSKTGSAITINSTGGSGTTYSADENTLTLSSPGNVFSIKASGVGTTQLAADSVTSAKILDGTIVTADLADNSVTSAKIVDGTIALADLANNSVNSSKIVDGTITGADIGSATITGSNIASATITGANIANAAITTSLLANDSVTGNKIVDGTITTGDLADNSVTSAKIVDGTITLADMANNSVNGSKIVDGSITGADISSSSDLIISSLKINPSDALSVSGIDHGSSAITTGNTYTLATTGTVLKSAQNAEFASSVPQITATTIKNAINQTAGIAVQNSTVIGARAIGAGTAGTLTGKTIGTAVGNISVTDGLEILNATNNNQNATMNSIAGLVDGGSVNLSTGVRTTGTALSGIKNAAGTTVTTLTGAANLIGDLSATGLSGSTLAAQLGTAAYLTTTIATNTSANGTGVGNTVNQNIGALNQSIGNRQSLSSLNTAINTGTATSVAAGLKAAGDVVGSQNYSNLLSANYGALVSGTNLTDAISQIASNIGTAVTTDTNINATNTVNQNVTSLSNKIGSRTYTNNNVLTDNQTITASLDALDTKIGTVTTTHNNVSNTNTIAQNTDALNTTIGDFSTLNNSTTTNFDKSGTQAPDVTTALNELDNTLGDIGALDGTDGTGNTGNLSGSDSTVADHLSAIDNRLGQVDGLATKLTNAGTYKGNLAAGSTVEDHLTALDASLGDSSLLSGSYVSATTDVATNLQSLNDGIEDVAVDLNRTQGEMKAGFASTAALTALVPNARAANDTQISIGSGTYRGRVGFAVGAFHYVNRNVLLNAGAAYAGSKSAIGKIGITFGW